MELPIDILASIYLYLQKDEDRLNFRKTCTAAYHFQQTVNEPHTLEQIKKYQKCIFTNLQIIDNEDFLHIPPSIVKLSCNNFRTQLPNMPQLISLECVNNNLMRLPNVPQLTYLDCHNNQLTHA